MDAHICLFNSEAYHRTNMRPDQSYVRIDHHEEGRLVGTLAGVMDADTLDCGWHAPFGGVDLTGKAELAGRVAALVRTAIGEADRLGARRLRVRCRPAYSSEQESVGQYALLSQGFAVESVELSLGLTLSPPAGIEGYLAGLPRRARAVLRRNLATNLAWTPATRERDWAEGYDVFSVNKARLGAEMRYGLDQVLSLVERFPKRIRMHLLKDGPTSVAAAMVYRVLPGLDYVVAAGQIDHELPQSPMNLVLYRIVEDSLASGAEVVDLGVSSKDGQANDGLVQFKRHVGCAPALRLDLVRDLTS